MTSTAAERSEWGMSRRRMTLVYGLIFIAVAGSAFCIVTDTEYWPFSQYPMYSNIEHPGPFNFLMMWGVPAEEGKSEFCITNEDYIIPFDWVRLNRAFTRLDEMLNHQEKLEAGLRDCWARYDRLRAAGIHHGPVLRGVRLYRYAWDYVDPHVKLKDERPDHRVLLAEVTVHERGTEK